MRNKFLSATLKITFVISAHLFLEQSAAAETKHSGQLEEVIVTAQKREQSLQTVPIAVSVVDSSQLESLGIKNMNDLGSGIIPALHSHSFGNSSSTQVMTIRGNSPVDVAPITRDASVAVYLDGYYLGRAQGLTTEMIDPQRVEVLRGPQGTLFGRNATGGAVNIISKRPTGNLRFQQTFGAGSYDERNSISRLELPTVAGIKTKLDYVYHDRDGWINNTAQGEEDFGAYKKQAARFTASSPITDAISADYFYDDSKVRSTMPYFQMYKDYNGAIGEERDRRKTTRAAVTPLDFSVNQQQGHALTVQWDISDRSSVKSMTGYRKLSDHNRGNFNGVLYYNGFVPWINVAQSQLSQEFQFVGEMDRLNWIAGLYLYRENARQESRSYFSLDEFGLVTGIPFTPIIPATDIDPYTGLAVPPQVVHMDANSRALYGQATWTPALMHDRLHFTAGGRYTKDRKSGDRNSAGNSEFKLHSGHFDPMATIAYDWTADVMSYVKWSKAYRSGGTNPLSLTFEPFGPEVVETWELGNKAEFFDHRLRLNMDVFYANYEHMQMDFHDPNHAVVVQETINAQRDATVKGVEVDLTATPVERLVIGLSYTYLDGHMPLQPNPFVGGELQKFETTQTPKHAGALSIDYQLKSMPIGKLLAHVELISTSDYAYVAFNNQRHDASTIANARLTLSDILLNGGSLKFSVWGKNLTNEENIDFAFTVGQPAAAVVQAFNDPRTFGAEVTYDF